MKNTQIFIDDNSKTDKECEFHCSPTCHPGQIDHNKWHYGCTHKAWPQNQQNDFVPFVECDGDISKCELKNTKIYNLYIKGKKLSLKYAKKKVEKLEKQINDYVLRH